MKFPFPFGFKPSSSNGETIKESGLGTFGGVYTPSILTILGVIMYLRFGWVVGNAGLINTLIIVTISTAITLLTALSICAIATDRVVRGGGAYYMISRSLGIEPGGAVGISLYFAQAISVALYTIGFAESIVRTNLFIGIANFGFNLQDLNQTYVALFITILVGILALTSASIAIKAQYFIMAAIALSLVSFVFGHTVPNVEVQMFATPPEDAAPFWTVFAVFFPAVTGIMAGVNMSGDLEDPVKSIPTGTLAAVITGYVIYMILPIFLAFRVDTESLRNVPLIMQKISLWGPAILLGVWGATLSSAIGSILGAPRVLQALTRDGVLPRFLSFLGDGHGKDDEPRNGTLVTLGFAIAAVCIGDLNLIAPILSMFFLTTYLVLNVAAGVEGFLQSPSFRPTFRVHWSLSLLGAVGCLWVMFLIDASSTAIAAVIVSGVFVWLQQRELRTTWGDVRRGMWMALIGMGIFQMAEEDDTKNWRPHILVLSGAPQKRWSLIELADGFSHNRSLMTVSSVLPSASRDLGRQIKLEKTIRDYLRKRGVQALVRVTTASDPFEGAMRLVETYGLGPLVPNTIVMGDSEDPSRRKQFCQAIAQIHASRRNVVIFRENPKQIFGGRRRIDVWWGGLQANGSLMLLLAYLLSTDISWRNPRIYLKLVVPDEAAAIAARENIKSYINKLRIDVKSQVYISQGRPFADILRQFSKNADLVFLGMATPNENYTEYYENLQAKVVGLPSTVFVLAAPEFAFGEVLTESNG
ncbi:amino acid transporter [Xenococcus sp. PCC 7305]|uniref:amino acid permease n=1 Tax=Xenococcus sp. PCC 7305 TaxID=102125 RepID=UPI0002ACC064|nr:amino acid permease [Xenococcus sp. PCC 7305]ELS05265.1 amino acid transporter [Xenococcus sp. PCC 7305]